MIIEQRIVSSVDDAEEAASGAMYFTSTDLELVDDNTFNGAGQTVGLRFTGLDIPQGAIITNAWLQFQVDETDSDVTSLQIRAHDTDDAGVFTAADNDISSRTTTSAVVAWQPSAWTVVGEAGLEQRTPNLRDVVQEIVDRQGWAVNNDLAFIITGSGERTAESYDGNAAAAPLLHIEYELVPPGNRPPLADNDAATTQMATAVTLDVLANDSDPDGDTISVTNVSDPANGTASLNADGTITYTPDSSFTGADSFTYTVADPDGETDTAAVSVTVADPTPDPVVIEQRIASGADDAEEAASGAMYFTSTDLELVDDNTFNGAGQTVGLRFTGLDIPQGAIITNAWLQFQVDETDNEATSLQIRAHDTDDAGAFTAADNDISSRTTTSAVVAWQPSAWTVVGEAGLEQRTPNLRDVVQEIVDRQGWAANNDLAFVITGTGERTAESYDGNAAAAPLLHIEYELAPPGNRPPLAEDDAATTQAVTAVTVDVLSNDSDPDGDTISVTAVSDPANGAASLNADGTVTYTPDGGFTGTDSFTYTVSDPDGEIDAATVSVTVDDPTPDPVVIEQRIASSADDAEEAASGAMYFTSTDIELVDDTFNGPDQTVGLRFIGLDIPQGAIITNAWLQFQVDEEDSEVTSLQIRAHDTDDAGAFTAADNDISSRATTSSVVDWQPSAWTVVGEAGLEQRTPNLRDVVQEIVDRQGWAPNNDLAFIITGSGERTAESYDGNAAAAPLLHIEYILPQSGNEAPTAITLSNPQSVTENAAGVVIGTLDVVDPDTGDSHTFSVSDTRFEVVGSALKLRDGARLDFEAESEVNVDVTAIDSGGLQVTETFTVSVDDVPEIRFAAFGDYAYGADTQAVADLVDSLDVDFIITTGDNAYDSVPIDDNIGQFYSGYIGDYSGSYGEGSTVNRFFPTLGNHEYEDDSAGVDGIDLYLQYFNLPGNERYYDFKMGPIHFFALNVHPDEPDGIDSSSAQAQWLQAGLAASDAAHKVVFFHDPAFSSGFHGSSPILQWPFEDWGATAVLNGDDHNYERIIRDDNGDGTDLPYLVSGLGGRSFRDFNDPPVEGSEAQFTGNFGTILVQASDSTMTFEFVSVEGGGTVVDRYTIELPGTDPLAADDDDTLNGGPGDDFMNGLSGDDVLDGAGGDDTLVGGTGDDILTGGPGDDLFVFENGSGSDTITDFNAGQSTPDRIDISDFGFTDFGDLSSAFSENGGDVEIQLDADDQLVLENTQIAALDPDDFQL